MPGSKTSMEALGTNSPGPVGCIIIEALGTNGQGLMHSSRPWVKMVKDRTLSTVENVEVLGKMVKSRLVSKGSALGCHGEGAMLKECARVNCVHALKD